MKKVAYMGIEYEVPDWVNWVAADDSGEVYGYDLEPRDCLGWFIANHFGGRVTRIAELDRNYKAEQV